jgi:hypothetical protein
MPLEKWVGRFLIDECERLVKTAEEMRVQYVSHQARNILLLVAAIRERRRRELIRIGSKGTSKEKQGTRRGHWRSGSNPVNVSRDFVKAVCPIQKQSASSPPTISVPALPSSAMKNQLTVCHICHKGAEISRPVMRRSLEYPPVPPRLGHCDIRIPLENM